LPLAFEANRSQADRAARYVARGVGYRIVLTGDEAVIAVRDTAGSARHGRSALVRMRFANGNQRCPIEASDALAATSNYFIGDDPSRWLASVRQYARVTYSDVYPGIDVVFRGTQRRLEYDFIVAPGASPRQISLEFDGVDSVRIDSIRPAAYSSIRHTSAAPAPITDGRSRSTRAATCTSPASTTTAASRRRPPPTECCPAVQRTHS
jgi:hypothetical protein